MYDPPLLGEHARNHIKNTRAARRQRTSIFGAARAAQQLAGQVVAFWFLTRLAGINIAV
jgi:hypothetical protein